MDGERLIRIEEKINEIRKCLEGEVILICPRCKASVRHDHPISLGPGITTTLCFACDDYFEVEVRK